MSCCVTPLWCLVFSEVWQKVLVPLERMRRENDFVKVFPAYLTGEDLFGLTEPTVLKIIESVRTPLTLHSVRKKPGTCYFLS